MSRIVIRKYITEVGGRQRGDTIDYKNKEYKIRAGLVERTPDGFLTGWVYLILKRLIPPGPVGPRTNK